MVPRVILLVAALVSSTSRPSLADVDLNPIPSFYTVEGTKHPNVSFRNGGSLVTYTPPPDWEISGSSRKARLVPKKTDLIEATIEILDVSEIPSIHSSDASAWEKIALDAAPQVATNREIVDSTINAIRVAGFETIQWTLRYRWLVRDFSTRAIFFVREGKLWRIQLSAQTHELERYWKPFRESLFSIEDL